MNELSELKFRFFLRNNKWSIKIAPYHTMLPVIIELWFDVIVLSVIQNKSR